MKKQCSTCKKEYIPWSGSEKTSKYCSRKCANEKNYQIPLTENEIQIILTGVFGDGCLHKNGNNFCYSTNSKFRKYIKFKQQFLANLNYSSSRTVINRGYVKKPITTFGTQTHPEITKIALDSIENNLNKLTDLGIALWFYDDVSLHYKKHFYNLNTQSFNKKVQEELFIPFLEKRLGVKATLAQDKKLDGRHFYYLRINKNNGAEKIASLLKRYYCPCFKYKIF